MEKMYLDTETSPVCRPSLLQRPIWQPAFLWTTGDGLACHSICVQASVWQNASPRSRSILNRFLPLFEWHNHAGEAPNILTIKIQPDEGINLSFGAKAPGPINQISPVKMSFDYVNSFGGIPPDAYERLLLDCIMGDATLFTRSDEVDAAWSFTTGILQAWQSAAVKNLPVYQAGTWGPPEAEEFARHGGDHSWHNR